MNANFKKWKSLRENVGDSSQSPNQDPLMDYRGVKQRKEQLIGSINMDQSIEVFWQAFRKTHPNLDPREAYILFSETMGQISEEYFYPGQSEFTLSGVDPEWVRKFITYGP